MKHQARIHHSEEGGETGASGEQPGRSTGEAVYAQSLLCAERAPPALWVSRAGTLNLFNTSRRPPELPAGTKQNQSLLGDDSVKADFDKSTETTYSR